MDGVTVFAIVGGLGTVCGIAFGYAQYLRAIKGEGRGDGALKADMEYVKRRSDDILLEQKDTNKSINALAERVTRVEESSKQAHKRLDRIESAAKDGAD